MLVSTQHLLRGLGEENIGYVLGNGNPACLGGEAPRVYSCKRGKKNDKSKLQTDMEMEQCPPTLDVYSQVLAVLITRLHVPGNSKVNQLEDGRPVVGVGHPFEVRMCRGDLACHLRIKITNKN